MSMFKRKSQPITHRLAGVKTTREQELEFDNDVLLQALREIRSAANGRTYNKAYIARLCDEALREIGY